MGWRAYAGQRVQSSWRGASLALGAAGLDWAEDMERVELNQHAPRCGVARACCDIEISACIWRDMQESGLAGTDISTPLTLTLMGV